MAEEVAQREAVDAFACQPAGDGAALVVEAEAAIDPGERLGDLKVPLDR